MHNACNPDLAAHTARRTTPVPDPHQSTLRRMCHFYIAGLPPQFLVELQFWDRLCIETRIVQQSLMPGFDSGAHLGHRRVHSHTHYVAARLKFCASDMTDYFGSLITQQSFFISAEKDPVRSFVPGMDLYENPLSGGADFRGSVIIPNVGHWVQQEAPLETNIALEGFLSQLKCTCDLRFRKKTGSHPSQIDESL